MAAIGKILDRVITEFSPSRGVQRLRARQQAKVLMNYDAATKGRRAAGWKRTGTDADAAANGSREAIRNLARDFVRNRPYAARYVDVVATNVVGTGIQFSVRHDDLDRAGQIDAVLRQHMGTTDIDARGECDLSQLQRIIIRGVVVDGEILARRRMRVGIFGRNLKLGFQIEVIEADHLDTAVVSWGQNVVIEGVEYGPTGAVEAYHLFDEHPGSSRLLKSLQSKRVPWQDVIHVRRFDRAAQSRGVSWLAPMILPMGELSDYQEAQILKQRMAALVAGVITTQEDAVGGKDGGAAKGLEDLEPGALVTAPPGSTVTFTNPPRVEAYAEFMREGLSSIAMAGGVTYESLSGNLSGVNFSSGRMGRMEMDRNVEAWQEMLMVAQFCRGVERWCREAWSLQPVLPREVLALDWTAPRRALIDPGKEIDAAITEIDAGLQSRQGVIRLLGRNPDRVRAERIADAQKDAEAPPIKGRAQKPAAAATADSDQTIEGEI